MLCNKWSTTTNEAQWPPDHWGEHYVAFRPRACREVSCVFVMLSYEWNIAANEVLWPPYFFFSA